MLLHVHGTCSDVPPKMESSSLFLLRGLGSPKPQDWMRTVVPWTYRLLQSLSETIITQNMQPTFNNHEKTDCIIRNNFKQQCKFSFMNLHVLLALMFLHLRSIIFAETNSRDITLNKINHTVAEMYNTLQYCVVQRLNCF